MTTPANIAGYVTDVGTGAWLCARMFDALDRALVRPLDRVVLSPDLYHRVFPERVIPAGECVIFVQSDRVATVDMVAELAATDAYYRSHDRTVLAVD